MTLLMGVVLILGAVLWRVNSSWEWGIPFKWQAKIGAWKESLASRTQSLNYNWYMAQESRELEKHLWFLKFMAPIKVEVCVHLKFSHDHDEIYIACLQRRFPEIRIYENPLSCESENDAKGYKI